MRFKGAGRALMAAGVACLIFYMLIALYALSPNMIRTGTVLLYAGIAALILGLAVRLSR